MLPSDKHGGGGDQRYHVGVCEWKAYAGVEARKIMYLSNSMNVKTQ